MSSVTFHIVVHIDNARFRLVSMMDDLEIPCKRKHWVDNDTGLEPAKDPPMLKLA